MELKQLQNDAAKVFLNNLKRDNIKVSEEYLVMKLTEELGEFVQSFLIHKKKLSAGKIQIFKRFQKRNFERISRRARNNFRYREDDEHRFRRSSG